MNITAALDAKSMLAAKPLLDSKSLDAQILDRGMPTGPSFAAALCGFLSTTVATTMVMFLISSV